MRDARLIRRDVLELADLHKPMWPARLAAIPPWHPRNDGPEPPPPEPTPTPPPEPTPPEPPKPAPSQADLDKAYEKLRKAETERDEAARKLREREDAEKTELERAQARVTELEGNVSAATNALREAKLLTGLGAHEKIGAARARAAVKLIDGVEYDDQGEPTNLTARIDALVAEHAALFTAAPQQDPPASPGNPPRPRPTGGITKDEAAKLARENPAKLNEMIDKGEIPASIFGG